MWIHTIFYLFMKPSLSELETMRGDAMRCVALHITMFPYYELYFRLHEVGSPTWNIMHGLNAWKNFNGRWYKILDNGIHLEIILELTRTQFGPFQWSLTSCCMTRCHLEQSELIFIRNWSNAINSTTTPLCPANKILLRYVFGNCIRHSIKTKSGM